MVSCDVLIVGAGPAGSTCAWNLCRAGIDVLIIDKCTFPRNKVCGGWIAPAVLEELRIDPTEYARGRILQPLTGFRTSLMGSSEVKTDYGTPISYGIRRIEFDDFLLARSGARISLGTSLKSIERSGDYWIANSQIKARLIVGAGGHYCPVARLLGGDGHDDLAVVAQECEFEMIPSQVRDCSIQPEIPELYFCHDMKGYGWCFRKQHFLNVGLGRMDNHGLPAHVADFIAFLRRNRKLNFALPGAMLGHAYHLYGRHRGTVFGEGWLLVGDAAGVAYSQSGEGIRPAIESGLLAATTIILADGEYTRRTLEIYRKLLAARFGGSQAGWLTFVSRHLPAESISMLTKRLLANKWLTRHLVLDRWFLRSNEPLFSSRAVSLQAKSAPMTC